jgi:magnesium transporter
VPIDAVHSRAHLDAHLDSILELLEKHRVLETWTHNQSSDRQRDLLESLVHRQNAAALQQRVKSLHPADLAYILQSLSASDRHLVWDQLAPAQAGAVLPELTRAVREDLIAETVRESLAAVLATMDADDLAFVSESLPADVLEDAYRSRDSADRSWVETAAAYAEDSVGRLMVQDYISVRDIRTVDEAVAQIRARRRLPRHLDSLFVVDARNLLRGVVPMRDLLLHDPACPVVDILSEHPVAFTPRERADAAAEAFTRYGLVCAPVVDERGKLLGAVAVDAVLEFASDQATRDIQMMGGVEALDAPYDQVPFWDMVRKRGGWLSALFFGEMLTATAMSYYEAEIARAVVLALFVPLIISSGGNSGSQAASLIIRALALKELALRDWVRVFRREVLSGLTLGGALGAIGFARIILWQSLSLTDYGPHYVRVAVTVWLSLMGVVSFGTLTGSMLPFLLRRLGFDPATSSAPFVATLVDVTGLVIYFQVAAMILRGATA